MTKRFYLDTSIWIDVGRDRKGYLGEPLDEYAFKLLAYIRSNKYGIVLTDILMKEFMINYPVEEINGLLSPFQDILITIKSDEKQQDEAEKIAKERKVPKGDVLHAILARDNDLIFITRDKHFRKLADIAISYKPEDII